MTDFLLELRSEEIPARMQEKAAADLARLFGEALAKAGIAAERIGTFVTPRRLALIARGLPDETAAVSEEIKGPRASAPPQAMDGFLRKTGLTRDQLVERDGVLFAVVEKPGRRTADVIADAIPAIVRGFPWPKSMRWGAASASTESLRWVRPLQGIVAILGHAVVPFEIAGVASGAATVGHRFHHPGAVTIGGADDYAERLRAAHVIVDAGERQRIVREGAQAAAAAAGLRLVPDEGLVAENAGLTEWPVPLLGRFDPAFLEVPREVIQLTMRTNQKYFACTDASGALAPAFVCTANIDASDGGAAIVAGNARVLAARLADAKFFWEQDLRVPLLEQAEKLKGIVFHEKLGTVADKVDRVAKLARWLVEEGIVKPSPLQGRGLGEGESVHTGLPDVSSAGLPLSPTLSPEGERENLADLAETAARLCKADLVSAMVGEFPELQGVMGGYYARAQGYSDAVADAIRDHYKPVGQGDEVPTAPVTVAVSLADKLDTVVQFFRVNERPSGSRDPFALRRSMNGLIYLILKNNIRMRFGQIVDLLATRVLQAASARPDWQLADARGPAYGPVNDPEWKDVESYTFTLLSRHRGFRDHGWHGLKNSDWIVAVPEQAKLRDLVLRSHLEKLAMFWSKPPAWTSVYLTQFLADRLKVQQREAGVRHDLIDAVFALGGEDDLVRLLARVHALQAFVGTQEGADLLAGYKRAANILKKEGVAPLPAREGSGVGVAEGELDPAEAGSLRSPPTPNPSLAGRGEGSPLESAEAALIAALDAAEPAAEAAVAAEDFAGAMTALASLRAPIDAFFDSVTVNDPDPDKRTARLGLLVRIRDAVHRVADFSKIEG